MERPHTANETTSSARSGIPVMTMRGKPTGNTKNSESPARSCIPRLQKANQQVSNLRSKSFDENNESRGFEMLTYRDKNQLTKQVSIENLQHKPRAKSLEDGSSVRGSNFRKSTLDTARKRTANLNKSTFNAPVATNETVSQSKTPINSNTEAKKYNKVGRRTQLDFSKRLPEVAFVAKKKKLERLKSELQQKQKQVIEAYTSILETKKLIEDKTGKTVEFESIEIRNCDGIESEYKPTKIDNDLIQKMEEKLMQVSLAYRTMSENLLENRSEIIHWLSMQHACKNHVVAKQLDIYRKEADIMRQNITKCDSSQNAIIQELIDDWKLLWEWRNDCVAGRFQELEFENRKVKDEVGDLKSELTRFRTVKIDLEKKLQETENSLATLRKKVVEKDKYLENMNCRTKMAEKLAINGYETKLKQAKQKQKEMELKNKALEQKMDSLISTNRKIEEELKNKSSVFDNKTKELVKSSKVNEALVAKLEKERIGLDMRIKDLQQLLDSRELEYENNLKEYKSSIQTLESKIMTMQVEIENCETKYSSVRDELVKLQMKCHQDNELMKKRKFATEPGGPGIHTQVEMDMWTELQATRVALQTSEEKLLRSNEEKERFLQTIQKVVSEKDQLSSEGWSAKLVLKDEEIESLKHKIEQLSDTIVYSRDLAAKQEKKISDLKKTLDSLMASDEINQANCVHKENEEPSLEIKFKLEKEHEKNQELEGKLAESEGKISQLEAKLKEQENLIRVRDGLIGIMKSKKDMTVSEYDDLREYVNDLLHQYNELNINLQAKTIQVDDFYTSIECKTMQIERLEKTVKAMEDLCQEANKTNVELQERIKYYQKQLEEYQMSVVEVQRASCESKGVIGMFYKPNEGKSYMIAPPPV